MLQTSGSAAAGALLDGALDWTLGRLDQYAPARPGGVSCKPLAELALACAWLCRAPAARAGGRLDAIVAWVAETARAPVLADRLARDPDELHVHVLLTAALRACGAPPPADTHDRVAALVESSGLADRCDGAFALLELRHVLELGGFAHALPPPARLFGASPLAKRLDPIHLSTLDVYAVTHVLMYATDAGRSPDAVPRRHLARVRALVCDLLGMRLHAGDWDLVGELLVAARCVGGIDSPLDAVAFERLAGAQRSDGAVPGRTFRERHLGELAPAERRAYEFERCYHPTLVAALAAAG